MKKELCGILCCPTCKGKLVLRIIEGKNDEIINGSLTCEKCKTEYKIVDGIPDLLPKKT